MVGNNIVSDVKGFSKSQLDCIQNVLKDLRFEGKNVTIETLGKAGDNFAADVRIIKVNIDDKNTFSIIVKLVPVGAPNAMNDMRSIIFNNEIVMYKEVLPTFTQLQEKAGINAEDVFKFAICYGVINNRNEELILLQDLTKHNYRMLDKFEPLSNETTKIVLKSLAEYHSLSYVLKNKNPEMYTEFVKKLLDLNVVIDEIQLQSISVIRQNLVGIFDKLKYKNVVNSILTEQILQKNNMLREADTGSKYSVISHGDTWTNNILFQQNMDGQPNKCVMIDYQMVKSSLPVIDILYLIFNCTDYETRAIHYYNWIDFYHSELEKSLFNFGLRINNVYPRDRLDSDLMRYGKYSLQMAILVLSMILRGEDESAALKKALEESENLDELVKKEISLKPQNHKKMGIMKERIEGLIDSCLELGYLNEQ